MKFGVLVAVLLVACGDDGSSSPAIDAAHVFNDAPADASPWVTCSEAWRLLGHKPAGCDPKCASHNIPADQSTPNCYVWDEKGIMRECGWMNMTTDAAGCCMPGGGSGGDDYVHFFACGVMPMPPDP